MLATRTELPKGCILMFKSTVMLFIALVPSVACAQLYGSADSLATTRTAVAPQGAIDVTLDVDNRLAVSVPEGV